MRGFCFGLTRRQRLSHLIRPVECGGNPANNKFGRINFVNQDRDIATVVSHIASDFAIIEVDD